MAIVNWGKLNLIDDGCGGVIYKVLDKDHSGLNNVEIAMCVFAPNETALLHYHDFMEEIYFIVEGEGEIEIDGVWHKVNKEDSVSIPIKTKHRIRNTSIDKSLRFLSVNSPSWQAEDMNITNE